MKTRSKEMPICSKPSRIKTTSRKKETRRWKLETMDFPSAILAGVIGTLNKRINK
jgi:hypothetical protein